MDCRDTIVGRRSCRAFLPEKIEKHIMVDLLEVAKRSPSYMNTQPWEVFVVSGEKKDALAKRLLLKATQGAPVEPDISFPVNWPSSLASRSQAHRQNRFIFLGIDPDKDKERVRSQYLANLTFYDAPCVVFIGMDRSLNAWSMFDIGSFVNSFLLAAHAHGLGACPQGLPTGYAQEIRSELQVDETIAIVLAIAMGYPDDTARINGYHSERKTQESFVRWYGF